MTRLRLAPILAAFLAVAILPSAASAASKPVYKDVVTAAKTAKAKNAGEPLCACTNRVVPVVTLPA